MSAISEKVHIACPYLRARGYLNESLTQGDWPIPQLLELTAPVAGAHAALSKDVQVQFARAGNDDGAWTVHWTPEPGGAYPAFDGELTVWPDNTDGTAVLEMRGTYAPPLGAAGRVFDAVLGHQIARATIRRLLSGIAGEMERRYDREA